MVKPLAQLPAVDLSAEGCLVAARAGDAAAFGALVEPHTPALRRFLGDLLRNRSGVDDALQQCILRAHTRLDSLGHAGLTRAWLFGIAKNVAFECFRTHRREADARATVETVVAVLPTPDPLQALLTREASDAIDDALDALSPERRAALLLRVDHGLSYDDIARTMGWTLAQVKNEIHRARVALRQRLGPALRGAP